MVSLDRAVRSADADVRADRRLGDRALVRGSVDIPDLAGGVRKCAIVELRCRSVLLGERQKATKAQRLLKERHGRIERALCLGGRKWDLRSKPRPDVVVGAHAEGVEAQRLFA